jgi:hypothetical protein
MLFVLALVSIRVTSTEAGLVFRVGQRSELERGKFPHGEKLGEYDENGHMEKNSNRRCNLRPGGCGECRYSMESGSEPNQSAKRRRLGDCSQLDRWSALSRYENSV